MAEIDPSTLSIDESMDIGVADANANDSENGSDKDNSGADTKNSEDNEQGDDDEPDGEGEEKDNKSDSQPPKEPIVDPEKGLYEGEYNKARFDGLMRQWQEDRRERLRLEDAAKNPPSTTPQDQKPANTTQEVELPPELQNADPEAKEGYKLLMRGVMSKVTEVQKQILSQVLDKVTEPQRREAEEQTRVQNEITELSTELGQQFNDNKKEILEFAAKNNYPLGSLKQATLAYLEISRLKGGQKTVKAIKDEKEKEGALPGNSKTRQNVIPKFDPERDGEKSISDLFDEGMNS